MTPLVNIVMPTYNHEKYVAQAIESVLAQKTEFDWKLMVGDDCSTDGTQEIVRAYAEKHPGKIEFLFSEKNLGLSHPDRVSLKLLNQCTSKYVGILDGDDYWTKPYRLQKLVNFLESHVECSVCFHNAEMFYEDGSQPPSNLRPANQKEISTLEDIITGTVPIPCAALFRNHLLGALPACFYTVTNGDWMLFVLLAEHGDVGYINEVMAAYRMHPHGIWSKLGARRRLEEHIKTYRTMDSHLKYKYGRLISKMIADLCAQYSRSCLDEYHRQVQMGEIREGLRSLWQATRWAPREVFRPRRLGAVVKNGLFKSFTNEGV